MQPIKTYQADHIHLVEANGNFCFAGIAKDTVALLMLLGGVLEIPSRIINGYLSDRGFISNLNQFTFSIFLAGLMALLCAIISGLSGTHDLRTKHSIRRLQGFLF